MTTFNKLADRIRTRIETGEIRGGSRLESLRKIAKREGLCVTTVSKAIDSLAKEGLVTKIDRKGVFVQKPKAAITSARKVGIWGPWDPTLIFANDNNSPLRRVLTAFQQEVQQAGVRPSLHNCHAYPESFDITRPWRYVSAEEVTEYGLDALLAYGIYDVHYLAELVALRLPMVVLDLDASDLGVDSVFVDNVAASFALTRLLIQRGHRSIAYIGGPQPAPYGDHDSVYYDPSAKERADGYRLAMRFLAPGLPQHVFHHPEARQPNFSEEVAEMALQKVPECTAFVCESAMRHSLLRGRKVEVADFGPKGRLDRSVNPHVVARAECDFEAMSRTAADLLLGRMRDNARPVQRIAVFPEVKVFEGTNIDQAAAGN